MACKGLCNRFAAKKPSNKLRYASGQKRCTICSVYFHSKEFEIYRCPCCHTKLRKHRRNKIKKSPTYNNNDFHLTELILRNQLGKSQR
ncbi:MAG: hypothetical protein KGH81_07500 [Thaumarchaeota archaeon]|nr:hypothetical protein [Nitrososphaerota archaeon]